MFLQNTPFLKRAHLLNTGFANTVHSHDFCLHVGGSVVVFHSHPGVRSHDVLDDCDVHDEGSSLEYAHFCKRVVNMGVILFLLEWDVPLPFLVDGGCGT